MKNNLIVIAGPTAVGKTDLSIHIAKYFSTDIISADSRQFYREMNIGTAKPSPHQLKEVKHHFINSLSVVQDYNAGQFEIDCIKLLEQLFRKNETVVMAGGAGLYINAVLKGINNLPKADEKIRKLLKQKFVQEGIEALQKQLKQLDPIYCEKVDLKNPQRLMRAIEVCLISGDKYSALLGTATIKRNFNKIIIGLQTERKNLYDRINLRVDKMIQEGLTDEVKNLMLYKKYNALQTVAYKEIIQYFEKKITLNEAIDLIKKNTRNYAKRQMTWFTKMREIKWFEARETEKVMKYIKNKL